MKWLLTLGFILIVFASQAVWVTFSPVLNQVSQEIGVPVEMLGFLAITYPLFFSILTIPSGILLDKNFRTWFLFGATTTFFAAIGRFLSFNYYWLLTCQLFGAIGQPFLLNAFVPYASQLYEERRAFVVSILSLSMYLGAIFALRMGDILYEWGGLHTIFLPTALSAATGMLCILTSIGRVELHVVEKYAIRDFRAVLRKRDLWIMGGILGFGVATFDNLAFWLQPVLSDVGLERFAGHAVSFSIILGLVGVLLIPGRITRRNVRAMYIKLVTPIITALFAVMIFTISELMLFTLLGVIGFLMLPAYPIIMDWIGKFHRKEVHGSASGFVGLTSRAISVALTLGAMYFIRHSSLYFTYITTSILIAFILALLLPRDHKMLLAQLKEQAA